MAELGEIHGLDEMADETGVARASQVFFRAVAGEHHSAQTVACTEVRHQFQPGAVGQSEVADDGVEFMSSAAARAAATVSAVTTV